MSENFEEKNINLGQVSPGKHKIVFKAKKSLKIKNIQTSCSCSVAKYKKFSKRLIVIYKADKVPPQIKEKLMYVRKSIVITYEDGTMERLTFSAQVINN